MYISGSVYSGSLWPRSRLTFLTCVISFDPHKSPWRSPLLLPLCYRGKRVPRKGKALRQSSSAGRWQVAECWDQVVPTPEPVFFTQRQVQATDCLNSGHWRWATVNKFCDAISGLRSAVWEHDLVGGWGVGTLSWLRVPGCCGAPPCTDCAPVWSYCIIKTQHCNGGLHSLHTDNRRYSNLPIPWKYSKLWNFALFLGLVVAIFEVAGIRLQPCLING